MLRENEKRHADPYDDLRNHEIEYEVKAERQKLIEKEISALDIDIEQKQKASLIKTVEVEYLRNLVLEDMIKYEDMADYDPKKKPFH